MARFDDEAMQWIRDVADYVASAPDIGSGDVGEFCAGLGMPTPYIDEVWRQAVRLRRDYDQATHEPA